MSTGFLKYFFGHALWTRLRREGSKGSEGKVLRIDRPDGRRVLRFDGLSGRGLWYRPAGDEYEVSVTDSPFCVIWHDRHSADWLATLASPYPASPDFPRSSVGQSKGRPFYGQAKGQLRPTCTSYAGCAQGQNKALKSSSFISNSQHNGAL